MPTIDPIQYLMDGLSSLTGGLISDLQTFCLGMVVCTFILMGLDYLQGILFGTMNTWSAGRYSSQAESAFDERNKHDRDSYAWQEANARYRRLMNKSVDLKLKR